MAYTFKTLMKPIGHPPRQRIKAILLTFLLVLPTVLGCGTSSTRLPPTPTPTASRSPTPAPTQTASPTPTATLTPAPTEIPAVCGGPRSMLILLIGSDARANTYEIGLADAIRLVRVDFVQPRVQLLTFQRDLYVEIPGIESHNGITHGKLNQAFLYGNPGYDYYDGPGRGSGLLALTMEHNFGVHADHYVAVNMQTFARVVDALGGIEIRLPYVIDGRVEGSKDPNRYFPAGYQTLNGYRTMLLARMRTRGDFQRSEIQNLILQAVAEKFFKPSTVQKLPELVKAFSGSVQMDLGIAEIGQLVCLAGRLNAGSIEFVNFPEELFENTRVRDPVLGYTSIIAADFDVLKAYVKKFEAGTWSSVREDAGEVTP